MKKILLILVTTLLFVFNLVMPTEVLSEGHPKPKEWKGEGTKIEFQSIPVITVKDFLNGKAIVWDGKLIEKANGKPLRF